MKKHRQISIISGALALISLNAVMLAATPADAGQRTGTWRNYPGYQARNNDGAALAAGIIGGLALGALAASSTPRYNPPTYAYPAYGDPRYMPRQDCYTTRHRFVDAWGNTTTRSTTFCD
jgi:hypothetical protein